MITAVRRTVATAPAESKADLFIRQQDSYAPWGLHYNAYQDTYRPVPARPTTRRTPRKYITA